jgi:hypothetical protein
MTNPAHRFSLAWADIASQSFLLEFKLAPNGLPLHLVELSKCVEVFVRVGSHGGFTAPGGLAHEGGLSLVTGNVNNPENPRFILEARSVDVRAFRVLDNLISRFSARVHRVSEVDAGSLAPQAVPVFFPPLGWDNAHDLYPSVSSRNTVQVETEDPLDYHKGRRCVAEFEHRQPREELEVLRAWIDDWATIVELGGYSLPVREPAEAEAWIDTLQIYDEYSVEVVFSLFEAAEEAWNPLVNLLNRFSAEVDRLRLVSIE